MDRGVARGKENDSNAGYQEVVEADLLRAVYVRGLVEMCQCPDGILCKLDDNRGVAEMFLDGQRRVKHWTVDKYAHLVGAKIEEDLKTMEGARGILR